MSHGRALEARGQATVELALGLLVFVTVLAFGIHFAEVNYLATRVQQAAAYAVYDATGQKAHEYGKKARDKRELAYTVPGIVTADTRRYFDDFDANRGADRARAPVRHVYTEVDDMLSRCTLQRSIQYGAIDTPAAPTPFDRAEGGVQCGAEASINLLPGFPRGFFDTSWNHDARNYESNRTSYRVCATPRSVNGQCGQFGLLIGDFSLQGPTESRSRDLFDTASREPEPYRDLVKEAFGIGLCPASQAMSLTIAGNASLEACSFQFSYQGVEKNYQQSIGSVHAGSTRWLTGGTNSRRNITNPVTYLGVDRKW